MSGEPFCSDVAREAGAPLAGTASRAEVWLLLEHDASWAADALAENDLAPAVRGWLAAQLAALGALGKARALFVRRPRAGGGEDTASAALARGFLAITREERRELRCFAAESAAALDRLDLAAAAAAGDLAPAAEPLTLICGNGRRDRCCARRGAPVFAALDALAGESVWLSTHQGGHRYAATGLWLPEGAAYGFLEPGDAAPLLAARARGALHLPRFRGRVFHPAPAQAADALLRGELGAEALDAWRLESLGRAGDALWRVELGGPAGRFEVAVEERQETVLASCSPAREKRSERFELRSWRRR
jgi:hypothetical protein